MNPTLRKKLFRPAVLFRWMIKGVFFASLVVVVLNPDLKRALVQIDHTLHPERLIQTNFPGLDSINRAIDRMMVKKGGSEPKQVERFVLRNVRYVNDYENWNNIEYWPTAEQVWERRQEDCDGRAVLAVSILRSRGFESAKLVVGLQHMWIQVDENEKDPLLEPKIIGLLNPAKRRQFELDGSPDSTHYFGIVRALLQPTALRDTSMGLLMDIPSARKTILMLSLLILCYHPARDLKRLLAILLVGLVAANLLAQADPLEGLVQPLMGLVIFGVALFGALLSSWKHHSPLLTDEDRNITMGKQAARANG